MESANDVVSAPPSPSPQDENNSESSSQLSPNHHQSSSQADQALLTQLPPTSGNAENYCNTQSSMPLESQCSQLMLATQPTYYNDSMLQTQFSNCNDHDNYDAAKSQYSQQLLPATQPANTQNYGYTDDLSVQDESSQLNTQDNSSQLEHLSMTQHQQALLLTQQQLQQQQCDSNKLPSADGGEPEYGQSAKQSDNDEHENDDMIMSSQEQRTNDQVEFLYNTQQNNEQEDSSDDDDDDDDDMERLVEEQNLAVSLSMEVIEECEESQRSRDNEARSRNVLYDVSKNDANNNDENDELQVQVEKFSMRDDTVTDASSTGFGFSSAGSGKAIAVNEDEMVKANKLLADDTQKGSNDYAYDEQDEPYNPTSSGFGFSSAGSGKAIAVNEEEMSKANKLLADDTQQKSSSDHDYDEQDEPCNPPSSGFGFSSAGSGKAIAVNEEEMSKANKLLADDAQQKGSSDHDYDEQDEPCNPSSGFGFSSAGSGKAIAVNEDEMAKANKLLDDTQQKSSSDYAYDEQDEPYNPPSSGFGFASAGSGKAIAVNEEEMSKANKLLADDTQQKSSSDYAYDEQDEPYNPTSSGFGFSSAGSGKAIAVDEEEMAKANKLLADDDEK
eukprot:scaffold3750_cov111-Skeletonema_dohrnii-CCMP3373.AAC.1